jgi:alcohol dehydrogenase (cytochrome c)
MKVRYRSFVVISTLIGTAISRGQGLDSNALLNPPKNTWPTYNGDYSGKRFSQLEQINKSNIGYLTQAWAFQTNVSTEQISRLPS